MGKKAAKKKSNDRGYCTASTLTIKKSPTTTSDQLKEETVTPPSLGSNVADQQSPHSIRVQAEASHILRFRNGNIYKGSLYPPIPVEVHYQYSFGSSSFLRDILTFTSSVPSIPANWRCHLWTYARANRVLHALEGAGVTDDMSCESIVAMRGCDERACIEWIIQNFPHKLPSGWCEYDMEREGNQELSTLQNGDATDVRPVTDNGRPSSPPPVKIISDMERSHLLRTNQEIENRSTFLPLQRARQLVIDIQRELDDLTLPPPTSGPPQPLPPLL